jgi:hypothetical protein
MILDQAIVLIECALVLITLLGVIYDLSRSYIVTGTTVPSV